jgi:hypothetical protein
MWLFTTDGFYSAVEDKNDSNLILVRTRWRRDLEALHQNMPEKYEIHDTPSADYPFRINMSKQKWQAYVTMAAEEIDYTNFKHEVLILDPDLERSSRYESVWMAMRV